MDVKHPEKVERHPNRISDVGYLSWCNVAAAGCKLAAVGCKVAVAGYKVAAVGCNVAAAGCNVQDPILLVFWICLWIPKNSSQSWIALVIKKAIKTPKLATNMIRSHC